MIRAGFYDAHTYVNTGSGAETLFVSAGADLTVADGSASFPYPTITLALDRARTIRHGLPGTTDRPSSAHIIIRVASGTYSVSFDPDKVDRRSARFDPTLERGPLLVNVDKLTLLGSNQFVVGGDGLQTGALQGTDRSLIQVAPGEFLDSAQMLILVAATLRRADGKEMRGDHVTISGFSFDAPVPPPLPLPLPPIPFRLGSTAIAADRATDLTIREIANHGRQHVPLFTRLSTLVLEDSFSENSSTCMILQGGCDVFPSVLTVRRNRLTAGAGIFCGGAAAALLSFAVGQNQSFILKPLPQELVSPDPKDAPLLSNDIEITHNDVTSLTFGVQCTPYFTGMPALAEVVNPDEQTRGLLTATIRSNRFEGVTSRHLIQTGPITDRFPYVDATMEIELRGNTYAGFADDTLVRFGGPPFIQDAIYRITDPGNELQFPGSVEVTHETGFHNTLVINGEEIPADE